MTTSNNASGSSGGAGSASSPSAASLARLEPWILLAKSARGVAAARIVFDATAAPGCYVFAELAESPSVKELTSDPTTHAKTLALLDLFQFGTLADYRARPDAYPSLTPAHIAKLRHLTLVTLASQSRLLSYAHLVEALDLANDDQQAGGSSSSKSGTLSAAMIRRLEDIIIEAVYAGLVTGKLDQKKMRFHVDSVMGRDVAGEEELRAMEAQLREWDETTTSLLSTLSDRINHAKAQAAHEAQARQEHDHLLASTFHTIGEEQQQKQRDMLQSGQGAAAAAGFGSRGGPWDMSAHGAASAMMDLDAVAGKKSRAKRTRT